MQYPGFTCQHRRANWSIGDSIRRHQPTVDDEDLHLRNYDRRSGYDVELEFLAPNEEPVAERRYYLQPSHIGSSVNVVPESTSLVRGTLDNSRQRTSQCRVRGGASSTVIVEVGNGVLTLSEGLEH